MLDLRAVFFIKVGNLVEDLPVRVLHVRLAACSRLIWLVERQRGVRWWMQLIASATTLHWTFHDVFSQFGTRRPQPRLPLAWAAAFCRLADRLLGCAGDSAVGPRHLSGPA